MTIRYEYLIIAYKNYYGQYPIHWYMYVLLLKPDIHVSMEPAERQFAYIPQRSLQDSCCQQYWMDGPHTFILSQCLEAHLKDLGLE